MYIFYQYRYSLKILQLMQSNKLRTRLIYLFITNCLSLILTVVLVIYMSLSSFTGFSYLTPLSFTNCLHTYYSSKYSSPNQSLLKIFVPAIIGLLIEFIIGVMIIVPVVRGHYPTNIKMKAIYLLASMSFIGAIIYWGYFLTFQIDFRAMQNCTAIYEQNLLTSGLVISSGGCITAIFQYLLAIAANVTSQEMQQKQKAYEQFKNISNVTQNDFINQFKQMNILPQQNYSLEYQVQSRLETQNKMITENANKSMNQPQMLSKNVYLAKQFIWQTPEKGERYLAKPQNQQKASNPGFRRSHTFMSQQSLKSDSKDSKDFQDNKQYRNPDHLLLSKQPKKRNFIQQTQSYQNYLKMLNLQRVKESQDELIAVIRSKYKA